MAMDIHLQAIPEISVIIFSVYYLPDPPARFADISTAFFQGYP